MSVFHKYTLIFAADHARGKVFRDAQNLPEHHIVTTPLSLANGHLRGISRVNSRVLWDNAIPFEDDHVIGGAAKESVHDLFRRVMDAEPTYRYIDLEVLH